MRTPSPAPASFIIRWFLYPLLILVGIVAALNFPSYQGIGWSLAVIGAVLELRLILQH